MEPRISKDGQYVLCPSAVCRGRLAVRGVHGDWCLPFRGWTQGETGIWKANPAEVRRWKSGNVPYPDPATSRVGQHIKGDVRISCPVCGNVKSVTLVPIATT